MKKLRILNIPRLLRHSRSKIRETSFQFKKIYKTWTVWTWLYKGKFWLLWLIARYVLFSPKWMFVGSNFSTMGENCQNSFRFIKATCCLLFWRICKTLFWHFWQGEFSSIDFWNCFWYHKRVESFKNTNNKDFTGFGCHRITKIEEFFLICNLEFSEQIYSYKKKLLCYR